MPKLVLIDTCIWAAFFKRSVNPVTAEVTRLLRRDRAAIIGPIVAEVLCGFRRKDAADWAAHLFRGTRYLEVPRATWRMAAELNRVVSAGGNQLPLVDLVIGAVALDHDATVFTSDPHFALIPDVQVYEL